MVKLTESLTSHGLSSSTEKVAVLAFRAESKPSVPLTSTVSAPPNAVSKSPEYTSPVVSSPDSFDKLNDSSQLVWSESSHTVAEISPVWPSASV